MQYASAGPGGIEVAGPSAPARKLTSDAHDSSPSWSPDGSWVAFWGSRATGTGVFVIPAEGGPEKLVAPDALGIGGLAWRPATDLMAFVRDHSIEVVAADGARGRVLVEPGALGSRPDDLAASTESRIVIGTDGPEHDTYRIPQRSRIELVVENRTNEAWIIDLEGWGIFKADCLAVHTGALELVAYHAPADLPRGGLATPPDNCLIEPGEAIQVGRDLDFGGAQVVDVVRASGGPRYPVILDLRP
jgi:dipeptidyl aminopeptidase/acylaminoacyl peptidase